MPTYTPPGYIPRQDKPISQKLVFVLTASRILKAREDGALVVFDTTTSITATLPPPRKGMTFTFYVKQIGAATGHVVAVPGAATLMTGKASPSGATVASAAGKGRLNTNATAVVGDGLVVTSHDGVNWTSFPVGTWATN